MTPTEIILINAVIGLVGFGGGRVWSNGKKVDRVEFVAFTSSCTERHESLEKLIDEKFTRLEERIVLTLNNRK